MHCSQCPQTNEAAEESVGECRSWCPSSRDDWLTKCAWDVCAGCSECESVIRPRTPEPSPSPTPSPEDEEVEIIDSQCPQWCATVNDWEQACNWRGCGMCAECAENPEPGMTPTTKAPEPEAEMCKDWCASSRDSWSEKCAWDGCKGCQGCSSSAIDRPRTLPPTPSPTPSPTSLTVVPPANCPQWCTRKNDWEEVCSWNGCKSCSECSDSTPVLPESTMPEDTQQPFVDCEVLGCANWCPRSSKSWEEKCAFSGCSGCSQCCASTTTRPSESSSQDCKSWCPDNRSSWREKCAWDACGTCLQCEDF